MKIPSFADLIEVKSVDELKQIVSFLTENEVEYKVLGWGANQLIKNRPTFIYLKLDFEFDRNILNEIRPSYVLPASVSLAVLTSAASRLGLGGWEVFTGIPASLGGAVFMNAGTGLGEIGPLVKKVRAITPVGTEKIYAAQDLKFSYRENNFLGPGEIIVEVELSHNGYDDQVRQKITEYLKMRNQTQPLKENTCGCMFKNYLSDKISCRAGQSIDIMGLKGFVKDSVQISHTHANFLINLDDASYDDVVKVISLIKNELYLQYGIKFDVEFEF